MSEELIVFLRVLPSLVAMFALLMVLGLAFWLVWHYIARTSKKVALSLERQKEAIDLQRRAIGLAEETNRLLEEILKQGQTG